MNFKTKCLQKKLITLGYKAEKEVGLVYWQFLDSS